MLTVCCWYSAQNHELTEVTRQYRALRELPGRSGSPPRKTPRLDTTDLSTTAQHRFVTG